MKDVINLNNLKNNINNILYLMKKNGIIIYNKLKII